METRIRPIAYTYVYVIYVYIYMQVNIYISYGKMKGRGVHSSLTMGYIMDSPSKELSMRRTSYFMHAS